MIELEHVGKTYGRTGRAEDSGVAALKDVSLTMTPGAVWAIVGPNGAGKSTLFSLVLGFLRASEGRVRIAGLEPRTYVRRRGASYLPERFQLPAEWRVRDTLQALAQIERIGDARAAADERIETFGLEQHADKELRELSRGLLQRVGLAQATLAPRDLVVFDEPTEGLDPLWRVRFRNVVDTLRAEARTILIASHDLHEIERLADHVIILEHGSVVERISLSNRASAAEIYTLEVDDTGDALAAAFPGAQSRGNTGRTFEVRVADTRELSARIAAFIEAGGILVSVRPGSAPLEDRVHRALRNEERA